MPVDGIFIAIGHTPASELFTGQVDSKLQGYIRTAPFSTATSVPSVCRGRRNRRRVSAGSYSRGTRVHGGARGGTLPGDVEAKANAPWQPNDSRKKVQMIMDWDKLKVFHAAAGRQLHARR